MPVELLEGSTLEAEEDIIESFAIDCPSSQCDEG